MQQPLVIDYGKANKFDFNNPAKWVTVTDVPLLDEHIMSNEQGEPVATVDRAALEEIARNNNKRVHETGDPATLILGHTSDDPRAEEKPAKGFVVNYRVRPFKRDPQTGQIRYTIAGDYKVRPHNQHLLEEYPRRSVELWWAKRELDPIAMLGGSSPERDLGVVIRNARLNHVSMDAVSRSSSVQANSTSNSQDVIRFSTRGAYTIETYSITQPQKFNKNCGPVKMAENEPDYEKIGEEPPSFPPRYLSNKQMNDQDKVAEEHERQRQLDLEERRAARRRGQRPDKYAEGIPEETPEQPWEKEGYDEDQYGPEDRGIIGKAGSERDKEVGHKRDQAAADQEALEGRRSRRKPPPFSQYSEGDMGGSMNYDDSSMGTDDLGDYDGGDEAVPTEGDDMPGSGEDDPILAKVFQSKQWQELSSKIDMIAQAITGGGQDQQMPGMGDEQMPPEMPPPGGGMGDPGMGGQAPPPGAEGMGDEEPPPEPEEDERRMHGQQPVQMNATGYPGPSSTSIPGFAGKNRMSRNGTHNMNGVKPRRQITGNQNPEVIKLQRQNQAMQRQLKELRLKYARADAATIVRELSDENIRFGRTEEEHKAGMAEEAQYIATMLMDESGNGEKDVEAYVNDVIRKKFARSRPNPAAPVQVGVARFARTQAGTAKKEDAEGEDDNFEDEVLQDFQKISEFANLQSGPRKMTRTDAKKFMRKKYSL